MSGSESARYGDEVSVTLTVDHFRLFETIGEGGMGLVMAGEHIHSGTPVAMKVLTARHLLSEGYLASFRREVQAMAGLEHPSIVLIYDHGEVDESLADATDGKVLAGAPYLVMERGQRTLRDYLADTPLAWPDIENILLSLLDALAHAHARGVIHRDIKPANVLRVGDGEDGVWKLTDFGIAHPMSEVRAGSKEEFYGTPRYMAPEQLRGLWRDYGPWTDLYSLGCLAYLLVTGRLPFDGKTPAQLAIMHLADPPPPLRPYLAVPEGFEQWVGRLLQKHPVERFQRAADATLALLDLEPPAESGPVESSLLAGDETQKLDRTGGLQTLFGLVETTTPSSIDLDALENSDTIPVSLSYTGSGLTPVLRRVGDKVKVPHSWRADDEISARQALHGAGLGLFGLRAVPVIGREIVRDQIWDSLVACASTGKARVIILEGLAGTGKSRLAQWVCERAHELGAAEIFRAVHTRLGGAGDGLTAMAARYLRCQGLTGDELVERTHEVLTSIGNADEGERQALAQALSGTGDMATSERQQAIKRLVTRAAEHRPAVVWLDDVQWGSDALFFVHSVLASQKIEPVPALFVLTVQTEGLEDRPAAAAVLESLAEQEEVTHIRLDNLPHADTHKLVTALLGFEDAIADKLVAQSGGNPLFAVQIAEDWVSQGLLVASAEGIRFRPGVTPEVPDSLHTMWQGRLERFLEPLSNNDKRALFVAAALGVEVNGIEWIAACDRWATEVSEELVEALVSQRMALWTDDGWAFVHGMLRETVERLAQHEGVYNEIHVVCAEMLERLVGEPESRRGLAERVGMHLMKAGHLERAFDALLRGAREHADAGDHLRAEEVSEFAGFALTQQSPDPADTRFAEVWLIRAAALRHRAKVERVLDLTRRVKERENLPGWAEHALRATYLEGITLTLVDRYDDAEVVFEEMRRRAGDVGSRWGRAHALLGRGAVCYARADYDLAQRAYEEAFTVLVELRDRAGLGECYLGRAEVLQAAGGSGATAGELFGEALRIFEDLGDSNRSARALTGLAEVERARGKLDDAEELYRRALAIFERQGSANVAVLLGNIGLVCLARRDFKRAKSMLKQALILFRRRGARAMEGGACAELLPCAAYEGNWSRWDKLFARAHKLIREANTADPDDAWPLELGAELAAQAGETRRARNAYQFSRDLWAQIGREDAVARIETALRDLA